MKKITALAALAALTGCLSSAPKAPTYWTIDIAPGEVEYSSVTVSAPYDQQEIAVLRYDGSVAFDAFNSFAARPQQLLRAGVTPGRGPAVTIRRLALDCRNKGERVALVEAVVMREGKEVLFAARSPTRDRNYTRAFSSAFTDVMKLVNR